ncbi:Glutamine synthetase, catalytic domain [Methylobacterium phyllostachyos]|uniref:Glutamine synthetase, catalytic domain n=1 Tax=Methylobacterium phyllostachyos TaxID=582672 RepID=A0A1H0KQI9_9HYPH|nr:glutamine synthetase [Methylobacterium phyllostachyos]SDO58227.1 Glutamine synthetase, catalytic domain [Methylobacterium phyllostachyos]
MEPVRASSARPGPDAPALAVPPKGASSGTPVAAPRVSRSWIGPSRPQSRRRRMALTVLSFLIPLGLWAAFSYVPFLWHPLVEVTDPGDVAWMEPGMRVPKAAFAQTIEASRGGAAPQGKPANPVYLPAPHEVAAAFWRSLTAPPPQRDAIWLPASLWHSVQIILAAALVLAAGLEGVRERIDPGAPNEDNLYELTEAQRRDRGIAFLPQTLAEAVEAFAADSLMEATLGAGLRDAFIHAKREEWTAYHLTVSPWEIARYSHLF